jgi:hypothetical protein
MLPSLVLAGDINELRKLVNQSRADCDRSFGYNPRSVIKSEILCSVRAKF